MDEDSGLARPQQRMGGGASQGNHLLQSLPAEDRRLLEPHLERLQLPVGRTLFAPGDMVTHVHFPCTGTVVSLAAELPDGTGAEAAVIGGEGAVGGVISGGHHPAFARAEVQVGGAALRIEAARLDAVRAQSHVLHDTLTRFADALLAQVLQMVVCNAVHSVEQRAGRWLLAMLDRTGRSEMALTQEQLSDQLGVRRTTITRVLAQLEDAGVISRRRGRITVTQPPGLKRLACECHGAVREHYDRLLPGLQRQVLTSS